MKPTRIKLCAQLVFGIICMDFISLNIKLEKHFNILKTNSGIYLAQVCTAYQQEPDPSPDTGSVGLEEAFDDWVFYQRLCSQHPLISKYCMHISKKIKYYQNKLCAECLQFCTYHMYVGNGTKEALSIFLPVDRYRMHYMYRYCRYINRS